MARAVCGQVLKAEADCGYCATRREHCYGLKAHLLIDWRGVAVGVTVTATNVDERDAAHDVLSAIEGLVLGDKAIFARSLRRIAKCWASTCKRRCVGIRKSPARAGG